MSKQVLAFVAVLVVFLPIIHLTLQSMFDGFLTPVRPDLSTFNRPSKQLIALYERQVASRRKFLALSTKDGGFAWIYNNLAPEVYCSELAKIGTTDDGGKWMCGPLNIPKDCAIFSLGMSNEITFEEDIQGLTNQRCKVFGFDTADQKPEILKRISVIRAKSMAAKISNRTNVKEKEYTIEELMKMNNVDRIEILKMDIEGAEFFVMEDFLKKHQVAQILIEVHGDPYQTLQLLQMMTKRGYYLFHFEINGLFTNLCEYSLIHESALERYGATVLARYLD